MLETESLETESVCIVGMIGVAREPAATAGATLSVFGGGINPGAEVPAGVDGDYILEFARVHEESGFDMVLTGYSSSTPDGFEVAGYAAAHTTRLGYLIAHRPGFVAPTLAARKAATLDQLTEGRIALHIITGGSDAEQERDGDFLAHDARYRRTDEYMDILRRVWTEGRPFDYAGEFYRVKGASSQVQCWQRPHLPLFFGGASDSALAVGSRRADVFALWGEPRAAIRERIGDLRQRAAAGGRQLRFSLSVRPILADTEERAWQRAGEILARVQEATRGKTAPASRPGRSPSAPAGCWTLLPRATFTMNGCGCRWPPLVAPPAVPPAWWEPPRRSPSPCWPTTAWAAPPLSSGALTRSRTRGSMAGN